MQTMLDIIKHQKCIFGTPFGILLGHIVCKQGLLVDPAKIAVIVNLPPPKSVRQLRATLGHTCYYRKFTKGYAPITTPMEKLLKKDIRFQWNEDCQQGLDTLKEKMVTTLILVFPDWEKPFHVHRCINHNTWNNSGVARSRGFGPPYSICK